MPLGGRFKAVWIVDSTELLNGNMGQTLREACVLVPVFPFLVEELAGISDNNTQASRGKNVDGRRDEQKI